MFKHHQETIANVTAKLEKHEEVQAVIIGGSIAHGFETESSDVDLMIVVSDGDYQSRLESGALHYWEQESCTYPEGYVDGKYTSMDFIRKVKERGSEPARFAFKDAFVTYTKISGIEGLIQDAARYPKEKKQDKINRFYAQFQAWNWYCGEAVKKGNQYLLNHSVSNLILFGGRLILAYNEELYPYHKWFLKVLERVPNKPSMILEAIDSVLQRPEPAKIEELFQMVLNFTDWEVSGIDWPSLFMYDSEWNWLDGKTPVADV